MSGKKAKGTASKTTGRSDKAAAARKHGKAEKGMILLFLVLLIALALKSNLFDEVKDLSPAEQQFKDFVDCSVARDYSGILEDMHLINYRVFQIKMADERQQAVLRYEDPKTGDPVEIRQDGRYQAEVRGYLLWILPVKQFAVTAEVQK